MKAAKNTLLQELQARGVKRGGLREAWIDLGIDIKRGDRSLEEYRKVRWAEENEAAEESPGFPEILTERADLAVGPARSALRRDLRRAEEDWSLFGWQPAAWGLLAKGRLIDVVAYDFDVDAATFWRHAREVDVLDSSDYNTVTLVAIYEGVVVVWCRLEELGTMAFGYDRTRLPRPSWSGGWEDFLAGVEDGIPYVVRHGADTLVVRGRNAPGNAVTLLDAGGDAGGDAFAGYFVNGDGDQWIFNWHSVSGQGGEVFLNGGDIGWEPRVACSPGEDTSIEVALSNLDVIFRAEEVAWLSACLTVARERTARVQGNR